MKSMLKKIIILAASTLCVSVAFAAQSALHNQKVQDQVTSTSVDQKQDNWNKLDQDQKDTVKDAENKHLHNIHNTNKDNRSN